MEEATKKAIQVAGGAAELARKLGNISTAAICQWRIIPSKRVLSVEAATGVSRHELRPDLYPIES